MRSIANDESLTPAQGDPDAKAGDVAVPDLIAFEGWLGGFDQPLGGDRGGKICDRYLALL